MPQDQIHLYKLPTLLNAEHYLTQHGYTYWTRYQPGSRFWPFQWIESGWLLALSALLIAATIWLVRLARDLNRRVTTAQDDSSPDDRFKLDQHPRPVCLAG